MVGATGAALGLWIVGSAVFGWVPRLVSLSLLAGVVLLCVAHDLRWIRIRLPQNRRQVPESVFSKGRVLGSLQFGFEMGTGMRTFVTATSPYIAAFAVLALVPALYDALAVGFGFALGRATVPWSWMYFSSKWQDGFVSRARRLKAAGMLVTIASMGAILSAWSS